MKKSYLGLAALIFLIAGGAKPAAPAPTVTVDTVDFCTQRVTGGLSPSGTKGTLTITYITANNKVRTLATWANATGGARYALFFKMSDLVDGDQIRTIKAAWKVGNTTVTGSKSVSADVLGGWKITCYNTPLESEWPSTPSVQACTSSPLGSQCQYSTRTFRGVFLDRTLLNGSGKDLSNTFIQTEYICPRKSGCPDYNNKNRFRRPGAVTTACNVPANAGVTAAASSANLKSFGCGKSVVIDGYGCRTVQDSGGGLTSTQLDLYQGVGKSACQNWPNATKKVVRINF